MRRTGALRGFGIGCPARDAGTLVVARLGQPPQCLVADLPITLAVRQLLHPDSMPLPTPNAPSNSPTQPTLPPRCQVWIQPGTGLADDYLALVESVSSSSELTVVLILFIFAVFHSGLAGLRPYGGFRGRGWGPDGGRHMTPAARAHCRRKGTTGKVSASCSYIRAW